MNEYLDDDLLELNDVVFFLAVWLGGTVCALAAIAIWAWNHDFNR